MKSCLCQSLVNRHLAQLKSLFQLSVSGFNLSPILSAGLAFVRLIESMNYDKSYGSGIPE